MSRSLRIGMSFGDRDPLHPVTLVPRIKALKDFIKWGSIDLSELSLTVKVRAPKNCTYWSSMASSESANFHPS